MRIKAGILSSLNKSIDHHLIGFEKSFGAFYRFEPKNLSIGMQAALTYGLKKYSFAFESNAALLRQSMLNLSLMSMLKLKHNGARLGIGFCAGFLTHVQTELRSTIGNTNHYYSDDAMNALQNSNKLQVDVSVELDQPIGQKQKFIVGLELNQNINTILVADFIYPYFDSRNALCYLTVSKNILPLTAAIVLKFKIK